MSKRILLIGHTDRIEFQESRDWLSQHFGCLQYDTISELPDQLTEPPSDVLLFQSSRGQFTESEFRDLQHRFPLASFCCVYGSWIEGETRSGRPLPGIHRISSQQFVSLARSKTETRLPMTAAMDERWLNANYPSRPNRIHNVLVVGYERTLVDGIVTACVEHGFTVVSGSPRSSIRSGAMDLVIYDAARDPATRCADVRRLKTDNPNARLTLLLDFPRADEKLEAICCGASEVLPKPFRLAQLFHEPEIPSFS